jgi:hypothetical protein
VVPFSIFGGFMQQQYKPCVLFWAAAAAAVAMVVGGFGPWATSLDYSANGTEGDGWIVIVVGGLVAASMVSIHMRSFIGKGTAASLLLAGGVVVVTTVYDINGIANLPGGGFLESVVNPGWGIYTSLAAGIALSVLALAVLAGEVMFEPVPGYAFGPQAAGPPQPPRSRRRRSRDWGPERPLASGLPGSAADGRG